VIQTQHEDISNWASRIDTVIANLRFSIVHRVVVIESTGSTQDAALQFAHGEHGLLVVASRQTHGRGTLGRQWLDGERLTLPCTFVVDTGCKDAPMLSACVGCAVHETLSTLMPTTDLKIKWPNDIVVSEDGHDRKIAGVLIEQRDGLTLVGIGINCTQGERDWDPSLRDHAVSLAEIGVHITRLDLVCRLVEHLSQWFESCNRAQVREYFQMHNAMLGSLRTFKYNHACYHGIVESIDPLESISIETPNGRHELPVTQTMHVRGDRPCRCNESAT